MCSSAKLRNYAVLQSIFFTALNILKSQMKMSAISEFQLHGYLNFLLAWNPEEDQSNFNSFSINACLTSQFHCETVILKQYIYFCTINTWYLRNLKLASNLLPNIHPQAPKKIFLDLCTYVSFCLIRRKPVYYIIHYRMLTKLFNNSLQNAKINTLSDSNYM